jgi:hypothetical protein
MAVKAPGPFGCGGGRCPAAGGGVRGGRSAMAGAAVGWVSGWQLTLGVDLPILNQIERS